ncbi:MAG: amino acid ABC transporter permease [Janthinobacterium lividum]
MDIIDIVRQNWLLLLVGQFPYGPMGGLVLTFLLSFLGLVLAFALGLLIALARISAYKSLRMPATALVYLMRGIPLLMLIFWAYFFVPLVVGTSVSGFTTMLCSLVIYESAYLAEIIRAGIQGLPSGQQEAARALGLSAWQTMRRVILPQALYNMMPAIINQLAITIMDTSLASVISVNEVTFSANQLNATLLTKPLQVYAILAAVYFVLCFALSRLAHLLEKRVSRKRAGYRSPIPVLNVLN